MYFSLDRALFDQHEPVVRKQVSSLHASLDSIQPIVTRLSQEASRTETLKSFMHEMAAHIHILKENVQDSDLRHTPCLMGHATHLCIILFTIGQIYITNRDHSLRVFLGLCFRTLNALISEHISTWNEALTLVYEQLISSDSSKPFWESFVHALKFYTKDVFDNASERIHDAFDLDAHTGTDESILSIAVAQTTVEKLQSSVHFRNSLFTCFFLFDILKTVIPHHIWVIGRFSDLVCEETVGQMELAKCTQMRKHAFLSNMITGQPGSDHMPCPYVQNMDMPFSFFHVPFLLSFESRLKCLETCHNKTGIQCAKRYAMNTVSFVDLLPTEDTKIAHQLSTTAATIQHESPTQSEQELISSTNHQITPPALCRNRLLNRKRHYEEEQRTLSDSHSSSDSSNNSNDDDSSSEYDSSRKRSKYLLRSRSRISGDGNEEAFDQEMLCDRSSRSPIRQTTPISTASLLSNAQIETDSNSLERESEGSDYDEDSTSEAYINGSELLEEEDFEFRVLDIEKRVHLKRGNVVGCLLASLETRNGIENKIPLYVEFTNEMKARDVGGVRAEGFRCFFKELFSDRREEHPLFHFENSYSTYWPRRFEGEDGLFQRFWESIGRAIAFGIHHNNWQVLSAGLSPLLLVKLLKEEPITIQEFQQWNVDGHRNILKLNQCKCSTCTSDSGMTCEDCQFLQVDLVFEQSFSVSSVKSNPGRLGRSEASWTKFFESVQLTQRNCRIDTLLDLETRTESDATPLTKHNSEIFFLSTCLHQTGYPWFIDPRDGQLKRNPFQNCAWLSILKGIRSMNDKREWMIFENDELIHYFNQKEMLNALSVAQIQRATEYEGFDSPTSSSFRKTSSCNTSRETQRHLVQQSRIDPSYHAYLGAFWTILESLEKADIQKFIILIAANQDVIRQLVLGVATLKIHCNKSASFLSSNTCFNTLKLPVYESEDELFNNLKFSIDQCEGFNDE